MKKKWIIPLAIWGIVGCTNPHIKTTEKNISDTLSGVQEQSKNLKTKITFTTNVLAYWQQNEIQNTITSYLNFFGTSLPEIIVSEDDTMKNENTFAYAKTWIIYIVPRNITTLNEEALNNVIIHEMFHVFKAKEPLAIPPYTLKDTFTMTGFYGLSIGVQKGEQKNWFNLFEEASAEALAAKFNPNYHLQNYHYANIGSLMLKIINKWRITPEDLLEAQKTNDLYGLTGKIFNRTTTEKDIESLMQIFQDTYATQEDITNQKMQEIENLRNK